MNLYDIAWIKATLEMGRTNPEYPAYKVLKLLALDIWNNRYVQADEDFDEDSLQIAAMVKGSL